MVNKTRLCTKIIREGTRTWWKGGFPLIHSWSGSLYSSWWNPLPPTLFLNPFSGPCMHVTSYMKQSSLLSSSSSSTSLPPFPWMILAPSHVYKAKIDLTRLDSTHSSYSSAYISGFYLCDWWCRLTFPSEWVSVMYVFGENSIVPISPCPVGIRSLALWTNTLFTPAP